MAANVKIGIIGGTGLDDADILQDRTEVEVDTAFGKPSDKLIMGTIQGVSCVLLARHGRGHNIMPSQVNYRANIESLRLRGCTHILATTACGSLREHIHPGDAVILDQFIDRTYRRETTFYDGKEGSPAAIASLKDVVTVSQERELHKQNRTTERICHAQMDTPFCAQTGKILVQAAHNLGVRCHEKGTVVTIEGPRFSSRAESMMFRSWSCDVVNMTTVPEVCLAKEAGLCYASIGLPTDYDSWKDEAVNVEMVMKTMKESGAMAARLILEAVPLIARDDWIDTRHRLKELVKMSVMLP